MIQKNKWRMIIVIIVALIVAFIFSQSVLFAAIKTQIGLTWGTNASPRNPMLYYTRVDENLAIDIIGINIILNELTT